MATALPKVPVRALKLEDRISPSNVAREKGTGFRHAHSSSDMATPARFGTWSGQGRFSANLSQNMSAKAYEHFRYFCVSV
jgi:DNA-binding protein H-NS